MKIAAATFALLAMLATPVLAIDIQETCTSSTIDDYSVSGVDDPDIPNCLVSPTAPYPGGRCERVQQWTNYGGQNLTCEVVKYTPPS